MAVVAICLRTCCSALLLKDSELVAKTHIYSVYVGFGGHVVHMAQGQGGSAWCDCNALGWAKDEGVAHRSNLELPVPCTNFRSVGVARTTRCGIGHVPQGSRRQSR